MKDVIFLAPLVLMIAVTIIIINLSNYRLKKRIIEAGPINENALKFLSGISGFGSEILKWGIILLFGGIGLIIVDFLPVDVSASTLPYGIEAICISLGFLLYYFIAKYDKAKL